MMTRRRGRRKRRKKRKKRWLDEWLVVWIIFISHLLCARFNAWNLTRIISFNSHSLPRGRYYSILNPRLREVKLHTQNNRASQLYLNAGSPTQSTSAKWLNEHPYMLRMKDFSLHSFCSIKENFKLFLSWSFSMLLKILLYFEK